MPIEKISARKKEALQLQQGRCEGDEKYEQDRARHETSK